MSQAAPSCQLVPAGAAHAEVMAAIHAICFVDHWPAESMAETLAMPGAKGLIAVTEGVQMPGLDGVGPAGLVVWRVAADEAEILTIAVLPPWRRQGVARLLLETALADAHSTGAKAMFLEVAAGNDRALALYQASDFTVIGKRPGYYQGADALVMRRDLAQSP